MGNKSDSAAEAIDELMANLDSNIEAQRDLDSMVTDPLAHELAHACQFGKANEVQLILNKGVGPNFSLCRGTPLSLAIASPVETENIEKVVILLKFHADPNLLDSVQLITPLGVASANDRIEMISVLIKAGADVNDQRNAQNWTALMIAGLHNCHESAKKLLNCGAKKDLRSEHGLTAFDIAIANRHKQISELLAT